MLVVLSAGALLFIFAGDKLAPGFNHQILFGFLVVADALRSQYMFNIGVAKGFEDFRATAMIALISTPVNLALVIAAWNFNFPVEGLLGVFVVSSALFYAMSQMQVRRLVPKTTQVSSLPDELRARVLRHMRMTAMTVTIGFFAASEVEVVFLNLYGNAEGAGQFKVAYQLASGAALLVPGVFGALLLPMMARALSQSREIAGRRFAASTIYLALLAAPLVAFGAVFGDQVIALLYGKAYLHAGPVFALCLFACSVTTVSQAGSSLLISADRQNLVLIVVAICGTLKLILDATLIAHYGLHGAIFAYVTVALVAAGSMIALAMRTSGASIEWIRLGRIVLAAGIAAAVAILLRDRWSPLITLLAGFFALSAVYLLMTLLLRCWTRDDIGHLQALHLRFVKGRPRIFARWLAWAGQERG
jgi:O-antigen/teichoic acid export membrane protein